MNKIKHSKYNNLKGGSSYLELCGRHRFYPVIAFYLFKTIQILLQTFILALKICGFSYSKQIW
jgi:hypothetical protein